MVHQEEGRKKILLNRKKCPTADGDVIVRNSEPTFGFGRVERKKRGDHSAVSFGP